LVAPICACTPEGNVVARVDDISAFANADGPATLRYWNQAAAEMKYCNTEVEKLDKAIYIFADKDVDAVKLFWAVGSALDAIPTAKVDPELVAAVKETANILHSITVATFKDAAAGRRSIDTAVKSPSIDLRTLVTKLNKRYKLQFPPLPS
jgi:hypothetical protein